jgi:methylated-DNA-[protein]-cysteine S-methyltransferase
MAKSLEFLRDTLPTPLGELVVVADSRGHLVGIDWQDHAARLERLLSLRWGTVEFVDKPNPHGFSQALQSYFDGDLKSIEHLPVNTGGTAFQREVWQALRLIPCGTTLSYGELARKIGRPKAVRAVGLANGANAIGIVVPCHRVVGSTGALTGYGSGLPRKQWLLAHERGTGQGHIALT